MEKEAVAGILAFLTVVGGLYVFVLPVKMLYKSRDEFTLRMFFALVGFLPASLLLGGLVAGVAALLGHDAPEEVGGPIAAVIASCTWLGLMGFAIHRRVRYPD